MIRAHWKNQWVNVGDENDRTEMWLKRFTSLPRDCPTYLLLVAVNATCRWQLLIRHARDEANLWMALAICAIGQLRKMDSFGYVCDAMLEDMEMEYLDSWNLAMERARDTLMYFARYDQRQDIDAFEQRICVDLKFENVVCSE